MAHVLTLLILLMSVLAVWLLPILVGWVVNKLSVDSYLYETPMERWAVGFLWILGVSMLGLLGGALYFPLYRQVTQLLGG